MTPVFLTHLEMAAVVAAVFWPAFIVGWALGRRHLRNKHKWLFSNL